MDTIPTIPINNYGVNQEEEVLPTMNLKVIDIRPAGIHKVYDNTNNDSRYPNWNRYLGYVKANQRCIV